jgi:hypothetical protein
VGPSSDAGPSSDSRGSYGNGYGDGNDGHFAGGFYGSADVDNPCNNSEWRNHAYAYCLK